MKTEHFNIAIPDAVLSDLQERLKNTRLPDELPGSDWDFGTNLAYHKELVEYWRDSYNWRRHEARLNGFAQFKTRIDDIDIHYIHEQGKGINSFPIVLTHGWPDSFLRFEKIIPMLTDPESYGADVKDSFDVVIPSLPGFGFSDEPASARMIFKVHSLWNDLMTNVLGYKSYGAHGGDWGSIVTEHLGRSYSGSVAGIHLTDVPFIHTFKKPGDLSDAEKKYLAAIEKWQMAEGAYNMVQSTRPQTLACGLNDSPAGLAAWILEKFQSMNNSGGADDVEKYFSKDDLLTNITIYWATQSIFSSFLPYYDIMNAGAITWIGEKIKEWAGSSEVPAGFAMFPKDNSHPPREWAERFFNVQRWTQLERGGHFCALEEPALLANEIRAFFRPLR
jgi:pimeloyl-ACP methyl ester carboxylesterase